MKLAAVFNPVLIAMILSEPGTFISNVFEINLSPSPKTSSIKEEQLYYIIYSISMYPQIFQEI